MEELWKTVVGKLSLKMTQTLLRYGWSQGELKWKPLNPADCYTDRKEENITAMRCTTGKGPQTRHVGKPPPSLSKPTAAPLLPVSEGLGTFSAESLEALGAFCFLGTTLPAVLSTLDVDLGQVHRNKCLGYWWGADPAAIHLLLGHFSLPQTQGLGAPRNSSESLVGGFPSAETMDTLPGAVIWMVSPATTS